MQDDSMLSVISRLLPNWVKKLKMAHGWVRLIIAGLVCLAGVAVIILTAPLTEQCASSYLGWVIDLGSAARCDYWRGVLVNLATEAIGIAIVVAIVDHILESIRTREETRREARRQANHILQEMHKAVYVWVGGRSRMYNPDKLADRLQRINPEVHKLRGGAGGEAKGANEAVLRLCNVAQSLLHEVTDSRIKAALEKLRAGGTDESEVTAKYYLDALAEAWSQLASVAELEVQRVREPDPKNLEEDDNLQTLKQKERFMTVYGMIP